MSTRGPFDAARKLCCCAWRARMVDNVCGLRAYALLLNVSHEMKGQSALTSMSPSTLITGSDVPLSGLDPPFPT